MTDLHRQVDERLRARDQRYTDSRRQIVEALATNSGLELSFRAEALHDARIGEQISLKNQDSGKIIQGIVTGKGTARAL